MEKKNSLHIVKRGELKAGTGVLIRIISILLAFIVSGFIISGLGNNPLEVYKSMLEGALGGKIKTQETVKLTIPLLVTAIGLTYAFKLKFWNIGGEGQILMGMVLCMGVALLFEKSLPRVLLLILMGIASFIGGALYGFLPALCKVKWNTNETLFTLMMNYIATQFVLFLGYQPAWQDPRTSFPKLRTFPVTSPARLPKLFGVHIGWIFAIIIVITAYIYWNKTKDGYEMQVLGDSENTASYAGMDVFKITIRTMLISAGTCGFCGFLIFSGADGALTASSTGGVGFTAITVSWLSKFNPIAMVIISFFISMLNRGAANIQTTHGIPASASDLMIGIVLFFLLGSEFFIRYKLERKREERPEGREGGKNA